MIENRKSDHVNIVLNNNVKSHYNYWDDITILHQSMPEIDYDEIDTSVDFLGRRLKYPIIIESMTGGFQGAEKINENIAKVASELGIGMGVGSMRVILKNKNLENTFNVVKNYEIPLKISNIGAPQLIKQKNDDPLKDEDLSYIIDVINANFLAIHFNFLQEIVQPEGERNSKGIENRLNSICKNFPVIIKETGAGIDYNTALKLKRMGAIAIDISGVSGTSFAAVEYYRALEKNDARGIRLGQTLWDWGIPSPYAVYSVKKVNSKIISSGGIRNGLDVARSIVMGADLVGIAANALKSATESYESLKNEIQLIIEELKSVMFLSGSKNIESLSKKKYVVTGRLKEWMEQNI
ncbi:MAG: type 2 isopentenyl-diphosphate Delta-isomerase [Thermoplasmata archaeon]